MPDHVPDYAVLCPGNAPGDYCDCGGDCTGFADSFCACEEAASCCAEYSEPEGQDYGYGYGGYGYGDPPADMITMPDQIATMPCAWREGKEELCGAKCEPTEWCSKYNDDPAACNNAYAEKKTGGSYGWCEHNDGVCKLVGDEECPSGPSPPSPPPPPPSPPPSAPVPPPAAASPWRRPRTAAW